MAPLGWPKAGIWTIAAVFLTVAGALLVSAPAQADPRGLTWIATIHERDADQVDANRPLVLADQDVTRVVLDLKNDGPAPVRIQRVRLDGRVIGLTFFSFTTGVDLELAPGAHVVRRIDLDLSDLTTQAKGLIPARLMLLGPDRHALSTKSFPVDVQGSVFSVYRIFGAVVAGITLVLLATLLLAIWHGRLPTNRWLRGVRFLGVGMGLGLSLTFSLSAFGLLLPSPTRWLTLVVVFAVGAFLLGYFLPLGRTDSEGLSSSATVQPADSGASARTTGVSAGQSGTADPARAP
jgi:hypothetical protein